jgi:hypothetical protein
MLPGVSDAGERLEQAPKSSAGQGSAMARSVSLECEGIMGARAYRSKPSMVGVADAPKRTTLFEKAVMVTTRTMDSDQEISIQQCEPVGKGPDVRVRCRVLRGDNTLGEFVLVRSDDGWLPIPLPGAAHEGLAHATAIDFARELNAGKLALE